MRSLNGQQFHFSANLYQYFSALALLILSTAFLPAFSQGLTQPIRVEKKEQLINQRHFGWERPLTVKDPNLSHWHWEPISDTVKKVQTRNIYGKTSARPLALKAPMPFVPTPGYNDSVSARLRMNSQAANDLNGKVMRQPTSQSTVATYGSTFHTAPTISVPRTSHTSVAGKVMKSRANEL